MLFDPSQYYFNPQAIPMVVVSTLIFATGLFVLVQNRRRPENIFFFLFCLSLNLWLYGRALMYISLSAPNALKWARYFAFLGVVNISPFVYSFSVHWLGRYQKQKKFVILAFSISPILYLLTIFTPFGIPYVKKHFWGYYPVYGPVCKTFLAFFFSYFIAAFYNFFSELKRTTEPTRRKQIGLITIAFLISITASGDYLPKITNLSFYPFGYLSVLVWTMVVAYAIVKYRTLDIQTVIHKTIMWLAASSVLGAPMVLFFHMQKEWVYNLPTPLFLLLVTGAFVMVVLYTRHIQPHIDHIFQRRFWDLTRAMEKFTDELVHLRGLDEVANHILNTVRTLFYSSNVSLLVRNESTGNFHVIAGVKGAGKPTDFQLGNPFLKWLEEHDTIVFKEYLSLDPRLEDVADQGRRFFEKMSSSICVPLIVNQKLVGVLNLGEKQNLQRYHSAEISFLADFRRHTAIALSNALHIQTVQENLRRWNEELEKKVTERTEQLKNTQAQLIQAEKLATIGTLAGGVAHEINNPLTAVLTNAQILKMTANSDDLESIELIEEGAKRCQVIIQSLLKYARKSAVETPVTSVDVCKVIQNVCSLLSYQLKQENIEVALNLVAVKAIRGVSNELEQVLTNLIVNARDAIRKAGRPGTITVTTAQKNGRVQVKVQDNGTGMPREIINKIFDPFFTTKDVGSGTGLGLAVSQSIIEKHDGEVEVDSRDGEGTSFTIFFPTVGK